MKQKTLKAVTMLSLAGLILAIYLTYVYLNADKASHTLMTIHSSIYGKFLGIPVAILGVIGYILLAATAIISENEKTAAPGLYFLSLAGVIMSARQMYGSIFVLEKVCPYCATSAVIMAIIFIIAAKLLWQRNPHILRIGTAIFILFLILVVHPIGNVIDDAIGKKTTESEGSVTFISDANSLSVIAESDTTIQDGYYKDWLYEWEEDCGCKGGDRLTITNPGKTETKLFYDYDSDGEIGSHEWDKYQHYYIIVSPAAEENASTVEETTQEEPNILAIANADFKAILKLIGVTK